MGIAIQVYEFPPMRGLDLKDSPLNAPPQTALVADYIDFGDLGAVEKSKAPSKINSSQIAAHPAVVACHEYFQTDGDKFFVIYTYNGKFYKIDYSTGAATDITPSNVTIASSVFPFFFTYNNLLWFSDGVNPPIYWNGAVTSTTCWEIGITAPSTNLSGAGSGSGTLTGEYYYKYIFYNSETGSRSNASPVSGMITLSSDAQVDLTSIDINSDAAEATDKRRIYRTIAGGGEFGPFYYTGEIDNNTATVFVDTTLDEALSERLYEEREKPTAGMTGFIEYNGSVYSFVEGEHNLYRSNLSDPEAFSTYNFEPILPGDGTGLTGLGKLNDLIVFKQRSVHIWFGLPGIFRRIQKSNSVGCISKRSIQNVEDNSGNDLLIFLSQYGPRMFDGQDIIDIGRELEPIFNGKDPLYKFNRAAANAVDSQYFEKEHKYYLSIPVNGATTNNFVLIYDMYASSWSYKSDTYVGCLSSRTDVSNVESICGGESRGDTTYGGFVFELEGADDYYGAFYTNKYQYMWNHFGFPLHQKQLRYLEVDTESKGSYNVLADIYLDGSTSPSLTVSLSLDGGGVLWDADDAIWDTAFFSSDTFLTKKAGMMKLKGRFISVAFRTNQIDRPFKVFSCRMEYQLLPTAGDRK